MTLGRLRWVAIVAPLAFLTVLWTLLHTALYEWHHFPWLLLTLLLAAAGVGLFSLTVFRLIGRLERRVLEQNCELEQRNQALAGLLAVGHAASSSLDLNDVLDEAMEAILEVTTADAAEVWLFRDDELVLVRERGHDADALRERTRFRPGEGLPGVAAQGDSALVVHDLPSDPRCLRAGLKARGFRTFCALPLRHRSETVGVLGVAARDPALLRTDAELRLLEGIGERVAVAIENSRLHERVLDAAVLEERIRLARELHDGLAQVLGYINTQSLAIKQLVASGRAGEAEAELDAIGTAARDVYADVRAEILGLRASPTTPEGFVPGLRRCVRDLRATVATDLSLEIPDGLEHVSLPASVEIELLRVVQEALANVRKHARAERAVVRLALEDGSLTVEVVDDGRGFEPERTAPTGGPRFGLRTMRERTQAIGGRLEIASTPGRGTTVSVRVAVDDRPEPMYARVAR